MKRAAWACLSGWAVLMTIPAAARAELGEESTDRVALTLRADFGFVAPLYHRIQYSRTGTYFDYVGDGGQGVLFPYSRFAAELRLGRRHHVTLLYQPLRLETQVRLPGDVTVDDALFEEGRPVDLLYNFPYYRATYLYDLLAAEQSELSLGGGLQVRNATIIFRTADGDLQRDRRSLGLVPLLKVRDRHGLGEHWLVGGEVAGFYAPVRYLNISDTDVLGAIIDANILAGRKLNGRMNAYLTVRYIGGGAEGTSDQPPEEPGDGFTRNWIHALSLALGLELRF